MSYELLHKPFTKKSYTSRQMTKSLKVLTEINRLHLFIHSIIIVSCIILLILIIIVISRKSSSSRNGNIS